MSSTFDLSVPVEIRGGHPVYKLLLEEYLMVRSSAKKPKIIFNFLGFNQWPKNIHYDHNESNCKIKVDDDQILIDRTSKKPIETKIRHFIGTREIKLQIKNFNNSGPLEVNVFCSEKNIPSNLFRRGLHRCFKLIDQTYLSRLYDLASAINYTVIVPFLFINSFHHSFNILHASGICYKNSVKIFTGRGGSGKTAISTSLLAETNAKYLGDDYILLDTETKTAKLYPMKIMIYHHNIAGYGHNIETKLIDRNDIFDKSNWILRSHIFGRDKVRRRILPEKLYFKDKICRSGEPSELFILDRDNYKSLKISKISPENSAQFCIDIMKFEQKTILKELDIISKINNKYPSLENVLNSAFNDYYKIFSNVPCYHVRIPNKTRQNDLKRFLWEYLNF
jgi:hypothetical protein